MEYNTENTGNYLRSSTVGHAFRVSKTYTIKQLQNNCVLAELG
jgi:hypothetical protein